MTVGIWDVPQRNNVGDVIADDDTQFIQETVNRCKAAGGGVVRLAPGDFILSDSIALNGTDVIVEGSGPATRIRNRGSAKYAFVNTGTRCGVRDLRVDSESLGAGAYNVSGATSPLGRDIISVSEVTQAILGKPWVRENDLYRLGGGLSFKDTQLTHALLGALRAAPQTLIPAPGAGLANMLVSVFLAFDVTTTAYTESADNIAIEYSGGTDLLVVETTAFIDQTTDQFRFQSMAEAVYTPVANEAIRALNNGDGEFGSGNAANTLSIRCYYHVIPMAAFS